MSDYDQAVRLDPAARRTSIVAAWPTAARGNGAAPSRTTTKPSSWIRPRSGLLRSRLRAPEAGSARWRPTGLRSSDRAHSNDASAFFFAALSISARANSTVPLRISVEPSRSTHTMPRAFTIEAWPTAARSNGTLPFRTSIRRSGFSQTMPLPSPPAAPLINARASSTMPFRTWIERSSLMPLGRCVCLSRRRLQHEGRVGSGHSGLRPGNRDQPA